jgi:hypothetical protein
VSVRFAKDDNFLATFLECVAGRMDGGCMNWALKIVRCWQEERY